MGRLEDKIAIVVGGGQTPGETLGNGRATCLRFAQEGAYVVVVDRRLDSAKETMDLVISEGGDGEAYELDATDEPAFQVLSQYVTRNCGHIDVLH